MAKETKRKGALGGLLDIAGGIGDFIFAPGTEAINRARSGEQAIAGQQLQNEQTRLANALNQLKVIALTDPNNKTANVQANEVFKKAGLPVREGADFSPFLDKFRTGTRTAQQATGIAQGVPSGLSAEIPFGPEGKGRIKRAAAKSATKSEIFTDSKGVQGRIVDGTFTPIETVEGEQLIEKEKIPKTTDEFIVSIASDVAQGKEVTPEQQNAIDFLKVQKPKSASEVNDLTVKLRDRFERHPIPKVFNIVQAQVGIIEEAFDEATNINLDKKSRVASDQALIISFNKMLDPDSVVRESEFARTPEQVGVLNRLKSISEKIAKGGLLMANEDRQAILDMARRASAVHGGLFNDFVDAQSEFGEAVGVSRDLLFAGINKFEGQTTKQQEFTIGQTIKRGGRTFKVVDFEDDEPIVEEVK